MSLVLLEYSIELFFYDCDVSWIITIRQHDRLFIFDIVGFNWALPILHVVLKISSNRHWWYLIKCIFVCLKFEFTIAMHLVYLGTICLRRFVRVTIILSFTSLVSNSRIILRWFESSPWLDLTWDNLVILELCSVNVLIFRLFRFILIINIWEIFVVL